jgi:hypothetical protein
MLESWQIFTLLMFIIVWAAGELIERNPEDK